jgi:hypothetical protein
LQGLGCIYTMYNISQGVSTALYSQKVVNSPSSPSHFDSVVLSPATDPPLPCPLDTWVPRHTPRDPRYRYGAQRRVEGCFMGGHFRMWAGGRRDQKRRTDPLAQKLSRFAPTTTSSDLPFTTTHLLSTPTPTAPSCIIIDSPARLQVPHNNDQPRSPPFPSSSGAHFPKTISLHTPLFRPLLRPYSR